MLSVMYSFITIVAVDTTLDLSEWYNQLIMIILLLIWLHCMVSIEWWLYNTSKSKHGGGQLVDRNEGI